VLAGGGLDGDGCVEASVVCVGVVPPGVAVVVVAVVLLLVVVLLVVVVVLSLVVVVEVVSVVVVSRQWSSFTPPLFPCGSQSLPFSEGSGLQGFPVLPCEHGL
jgi:hypothetical protein